MIFFNEGQPDRIPDDRVGLLSGTLGAPTTRIPVVGTTFGVGEELSAAGTTVTLTTNTEGDPHRKTRNVLAESRWGDPNKVVMIGAHLDSVVDGPGINDNGSGTAGVLETALTTSGTQTTNRLRFAFWGAEELGLLGSKHYVGALTPTEQDKIKMYLNFDMIASPNHFLGIYDGDNSDAVGASAAPGLGQDREVLRGPLREVRPAVPRHRLHRPLRLRPVHRRGHPLGGPVHRRRGDQDPLGGGRVRRPGGVAYDECYHKACDTIANLNDRALEANASAITAAALAYGRSAHLPGGNTTVTSAPVVSKRGGAAVKHGPDNDHTDVPR
ncbi:M20/M25/M40 family metallo-hydrolase [Streptosporangium lutulentum]